MTIYEEYLYQQDKYVKKYGKNTIVLMQIGSFYEAYSNHTNSNALKNISNILNVVFTKKDKKIDVTDTNKNYYMLGVPNVSLQKYLPILIENNYTVVEISQTSATPYPKREVTNIYSKTTYIENINKPSSNSILCIYLEEEAKKILCIGLALIDLSTASSVIHESYSTVDDTKLSLDETYRFIANYIPSEILIFNLSTIMTQDKLISYLDLSNSNYKYFNKINKNFSKITYQNELLLKIFKPEAMLTPIETLDLEKKIYGRISYIALLDHAYQHNNSIINNLNKPVIYETDNILLLENNSISQLNIFSSDIFISSNKKITCLLDIVDNTSTNVGHRFLKYNLATPITDIKELNKRYMCVASCIENKFYLKLEEELVNISDIERLVRKLSLGILHPIDLDRLISSFLKVNNIITLISKHKILKILKPINTAKLTKFIAQVNKTFNIDELKKYILSDISNNFFNKNIYPELDAIQDKINNGMTFMEDVCNVLMSYIITTDNDTKSDNKLFLKNTDRDGYYIQLTNLRATNLKNKLKNLKNIKINQTFSLNVDNIIFKDMPANGVKVFIKDVSKISDEIAVLRENISTQVKATYLKVLTNLYTTYQETFYDINKFIAIIDFIKSAAKTALLYNYVRPIIKQHDKDSKQSYINCKSLRHPIIERILDTPYIPHDINLSGDDDKVVNESYNNVSSGVSSNKVPVNGMLIYGYNSAGKSSLMKAVGVSVIMAQSGMYVPASEFVYQPYNKLFSRITSNDNLFKGMSSFVLELSEIKAILNRADKNSLITGDELSKGTEVSSATALVAATLIKLAKSKASFIFSSHLHAIADLEEIKSLNNIKIYHISVTYDQSNDLLVFDRKLKLGVGPIDYGLVMAKYILKDDEFIKQATSIKNSLLELPNMLFNDKKSRYNKDVYIDTCSLCHMKNTKNNFFETHHVNFQSNCDVKTGFVTNQPHIHKDDKANLIILCQSCHDKIHNGEITVLGYEQTNKGKKIKVEKVTEKVKVKVKVKEI